jgi:hypothetical protein
MKADFRVGASPFEPLSDNGSVRITRRQSHLLRWFSKPRTTVVSSLWVSNTAPVHAEHLTGHLPNGSSSRRTDPVCVQSSAPKCGREEDRMTRRGRVGRRVRRDAVHGASPEAERFFAPTLVRPGKEPCPHSPRLSSGSGGWTRPPWMVGPACPSRRPGGTSDFRVRSPMDERGCQAGYKAEGTARAPGIVGGGQYWHCGSRAGSRSLASRGAPKDQRLDANASGGRK